MYSTYNANSKRNIMPYDNMFYFSNSLMLETYIVGYKSQGESVVFFVRADGNIRFSGLVDCYKLSDYDIVQELLNEKKVENLNFLCWTHPDNDHSKGLSEIIKNYVNEKTYIWIPEGVDAQEIECSSDVKKLFEELKESVITSYDKRNVYSTSDVKNLMCYNSVCFQRGCKAFPLNITAYAPNSKVIRKQIYLDRFIKNDRSIFIEVSIGDAALLLSGDIENGTINMIPKRYFNKNVHILKIPHHGSDSSTDFLELGWDFCDVACSTVYRNGRCNLPLDVVMNQYKNKTSYLYCTGKYRPIDENEKYGVLQITTDIINNTYDTAIYGNADIWNAYGVV